MSFPRTTPASLVLATEQEVGVRVPGCSYWLAGKGGARAAARPEARRREAGVQRACSGAEIIVAGTQWAAGSLLLRRNQSYSMPTEPLSAFPI